MYLSNFILTSILIELTWLLPGPKITFVSRVFAESNPTHNLHFSYVLNRKNTKGGEGRGKLSFIMQKLQTVFNRIY